MQYIIFCYLIFYAVKQLITDKQISTVFLLFAFVVCFIIEALLGAKVDMSFLRVRQMLSFLCGVLIV